MNNKLSQLENELNGLIRDFRRIGEILKTIRDERLYRESYDSFENYCSARWHFTHQRANQFISAFMLDAELGGCLENESQARNLHSLPDSKSRQDVVADAQLVVRDTGKPFGAALKACLASRGASLTSGETSGSLKAAKGLKELQALFMALDDDVANAFLVWAAGFMKSRGVSAPCWSSVFVSDSPCAASDTDDEVEAILEEACHE